MFQVIFLPFLILVINLSRILAFSKYYGYQNNCILQVHCDNDELNNNNHNVSSLEVNYLKLFNHYEPYNLSIFRLLGIWPCNL